uniref:Uncharacterized protein n=1 Tax=Geladintestivirus 1 TaxID=3233133 RepID=A0AAU8MLZ0_9CAUD
MIKTKQQLINYLVNECGYTYEEINNYTDRDLFDKFLENEGIIGFTNEILALADCLDFRN